MVQTKRDILLLKAFAKQELQKRKARDDFWAFCLYYDLEFFSKRSFLISVAMAFMRIYKAYCNGIIRRLAVSMPPRAGKSYISSLFITWMFGHFPKESVMRNCCSDTLYNKLSYDTREIMRSRKYAELFPEARLKGDKQNVHGWNLSESRQVGYFGAGVGGTVIGFGASMLAMTDDLYKSLEDALSDTNNEKVWYWKQGTHDSRIEGNCCSIDIGTRWSTTDVLGRMEEMEKYDEIIRIPALDENDESFCEDVHTTEYYRELRAELDDGIWSAEYQQEPYESKGLLFPKEELRFYDPESIDLSEAEYCILQADPADKGDDFGTALGKVMNGDVYISAITCNNIGLDYNIPLVTQIAVEENPTVVCLEGNGGWIQTCKDIRKGVHEVNDSIEVLIYAETRNKEEKISGQAYFIKTHFLFRKDYERFPEYAVAMKKLTRYLRNVKDQADDIPDLLSSMSRYLRRNVLTE